MYESPAVAGRQQRFAPEARALCWRVALIPPCPERGLLLPGSLFRPDGLVELRYLSDENVELSDHG